MSAARLREAWYRFARRAFRVTARIRYGRAHPAAIVPDRIVELDPATVANRAEREPRLSKLVNSAVVDGDWDRRVASVEGDVVYRSFVAHFVDGKLWEETPYFDYLRGNVTEHGGRSDEGIVRRCAQLDELHAFIRSHGYRGQAELEAGSHLVIEHWKHRLMPPEFREVCVNVARDGSFLLRGGFHRLSIAKILGIRSIPVRIAIRHAAWQRIRDEIASGRRAAGTLASHPDIAELLDRPR